METTPYAISIMDLMQEMLDEAPSVLWLKQGQTVFEACWVMIESREGRARLEEQFPDYA